MRKKITLIIVALSLIVSFGLTNAYAIWTEGDPNDWYFEFKSADSTDTLWDLTFYAVDDALPNSFFFEIQYTSSTGGEFLSGAYDFTPGNFYQLGYSPMGAMVDRGNGRVGNIGGGIITGGHNFNAGESMKIAQLTFSDAVDLDWVWSEDPSFFTTDINGQLWNQGNLLPTNDGVTAPAADLFDMGLNLNPNTYGQTVPVPAAVWLIGSAMLCMLGINQRKKN